MAKRAYITVKNLTKHMQHLQAADGDSVAIMPSATVKIDDKFLWQINEHQIRIVRKPL